MRHRVLFIVLSLTLPLYGHAEKHVELLCHRTANKDAPENTMEALRLAALMGCDVIEIDVRRTLDGVLVLNHDGFTERLTDGSGEVENSLYEDLKQREAGVWMGERWRGVHIARLDEALLFAKQRGFRLILDIKTKGIGPQVLQAVDDVNLRNSVRYGGEWDDIRTLDPRANEDPATVWLQPGARASEIETQHTSGKRVVVNFSANAHEMDLDAMKQAVANGADGLNVDYVRLGADAVGRPVEAAIAELEGQTQSGDSVSRVKAVARLAEYRGFALQGMFTALLEDADDRVSRAAAVALVNQRPRPAASVFTRTLHSRSAGVRSSSAWALGELHANAATLTCMLQDPDPDVLEEALLALAKMPGMVASDGLERLLIHPDTRIRGAAAVALAAKDPRRALRVLPIRLRAETRETMHQYGIWAERGKPTLNPTEIRVITDRYRSQMKFLQAIGSLHGSAAMPALEQMAFHAGDDFLQMHAQVAAFQLWERIGDHPAEAVLRLGDQDATVADRAEWMLSMADARVAPQVRLALTSPDAQIRLRAVHVVAFRGDTAALRTLRGMRQEPDAAWAISRIEMLHGGRSGSP